MTKANLLHQLEVLAGSYVHVLARPHRLVCPLALHAPPHRLDRMPLWVLELQGSA